MTGSKRTNSPSEWEIAAAVFSYNGIHLFYLPDG